ncbi:hypothetical protein [Nannocystis punicea]|uniref:VWFA domain-containing protein n=1 Tax=Nannocystis punicea TaxID=2995304 RepID=A0ABY7GW03_9BACT|nr:hypothetical protein [Nannocystis poenicansa]WAS91131.1 hypothetical protein O0S08_33510 [Nannocystis poenicansa]
MNLSNRQSIRRAVLAVPMCVGLFSTGCGDDGGRDSATVGATLGAVTTVSPGTSPDPSSSSTTAEAPEPAPTTSEGTSTGAGDETDGTSEAPAGGEGPPDSGPKFDLGDSPDPVDPGSQDKPCVKIDLLFVVDNSSSMKQEQVTLVASFPTFVSEIQQELADAESLHIGVVSTDDYEHNDPACADTLGALVTQTKGGKGASDAVCGPFASGHRFMTEADDLTTTFTCAAQVGIDGSGDEMPIDAALAALGPDLEAPGACNEEFMREDALLVLVIITDEEEEGSAGDPPQWFEAITALKGGVETNVVVLSLIGPENPSCMDAAEIGERLIEFTDMFTYGSIGEICAENYQMFFHEAIAGIAQACDGFMPPG